MHAAAATRRYAPVFARLARTRFRAASSLFGDVVEIGRYTGGRAIAEKFRITPVAKVRRCNASGGLAAVEQADGPINHRRLAAALACALRHSRTLP